MVQTSQFGMLAKLAMGAIVAAVIALAAYFMQQRPDVAPAPTVALQEVPTQEVPTEAPKESPTSAPALILPSLDVVRVTPDGQVTIAGRAAPGASVSLRVDTSEIANAPADGTGAYASLFSLPASDKVRILTVAATGADGVEVLGKDQVVLAPTVLPQVAVAEPAPLKITEMGVQVLEPVKILGNIVINSITYADDLVLVGGLGQADQAVRLYVDDAEAASTKIAANGTWSASLPQIAPGVYTLRADQLDADGKVTSRYETPFKRESIESLAAAAQNDATTSTEVAETDTANTDTASTATASTAAATTEAAAPVAAPTTATVTVQPGLTLWSIAEQKLGDGAMYVQVFEANKDQIRDPDLIYPGQIFTLPISE